MRPAKQLVEETGSFSLRRFFDSSKPDSTALPIEHSPVDKFPNLNTQPTLRAALHTKIPPYVPSVVATNGSATTETFKKDSKFTFNGLVSPPPTKIQNQHLFLNQHQKKVDTAKCGGLKNTTCDDDEVVRLKVQVISLNDKLEKASANLLQTSESVAKGNRALSVERAQFNSKFYTISNRLRDTQASLENALGVSDTTSKKLMVQIAELRVENDRISASRDKLEFGLAITDSEEADHANVFEQSIMAIPTTMGSHPDNAETQDLTARMDALNELHDDLKANFTELSAQHSVMIEDRNSLSTDLEIKTNLLEIAAVEVEASELKLQQLQSQVTCLTGEVDSLKSETAMADGLVDKLDAALAAERLSTTEVSCPLATRCQELEKVAQKAKHAAFNSSEEDCKLLHEEFKFTDAIARRARFSLDSGEPERAVATHVYTGGKRGGGGGGGVDRESFSLADHIHTNPRTMGKPFDGSILHCSAIGDNFTGSNSMSRQDAFVKAVSTDLKCCMDSSRELYKSSSTTGAALRV